MVPYEMLAVMCNIEDLEENLTQYDRPFAILNTQTTHAH